MKTILVTVVMMAMILTGCNQKSTLEYETINLDEIQSKVEEGYIVMDVREIDEYNSGHIVGAINKPLSDLKKDDFVGLDTEKDYVVICRSGNRSIEASKILVADDYHVVNVSEGMSTWTGEVE